MWVILLVLVDNEVSKNGDHSSPDLITDSHASGLNLAIDIVPDDLACWN